jgi:hypothetical protein
MCEVWSELEHHMGLLYLPNKDTVSVCSCGFFIDLSLKPIIFLPIVVAWGLWLAQNEGVSEGEFYPPFKVSQQALSRPSIYKGVPSMGKSWVLEVMDINRNMACGLFDGAFQG